MGENRHLPESELDIMLVVMGGGGPSVCPSHSGGAGAPAHGQCPAQLSEAAGGEGLSILQKTGKVNTYTAMVAREDYQRSEGESFLKKLYGSSISRFAAALYDGKRVEPAELEELQALLDRLSGGEET